MSWKGCLVLSGVSFQGPSVGAFRESVMLESLTVINGLLIGFSISYISLCLSGCRLGMTLWSRSGIASGVRSCSCVFFLLVLLFVFAFLSVWLSLA